MYAFKNIVVTTDLSTDTDAAIPFAIALTKQTGGKIHLFHVLEKLAGETLVTDDMFGIPLWHVSMREERRKKLAQMATELEAKTGLTITHTCISGQPVVEVLKFMEAVQADLILLATHGRSGIPHWFLGSVAEKIVRLSTIPVLTVRSGESVLHDMKFESILVPTDFSENAEAAIPFAVALAKSSGAKLILTHVLENSNYYVDATWNVELGSNIEQWTQVMAEMSEKKLANAALELSKKSELVVTTILRSGRADQEICNVAREQKADLIVMSTHGYTGFSHLAFGSVTEQVLRSSPVPVMSINIAAIAPLVAPVAI